MQLQEIDGLININRKQLNMKFKNVEAVDYQNTIVCNMTGISLSVLRDRDIDTC